MLFVRTCFAFTLLEAIPRLYTICNLILSGQRIFWSLIYGVLYILMIISAWRMLRHHHIPSARGLMTLRIGLIVATSCYFLLLKPIPPISLLLMPLMLPAFQLFLAYKAHRCLFSIASRKC